MTRMHISIVIIIAALAGCTTSWQKPGATEADFERDDYVCSHQTAMLPEVHSPSIYQVEDPYAVSALPGQATTQLGDSMQTIALQERMHARCLRVKGWKPEP